jgi:hypothetical protein
MGPEWCAKRKKPQTRVFYSHVGAVLREGQKYANI